LTEVKEFSSVVFVKVDSDELEVSTHNTSKPIFLNSIYRVAQKSKPLRNSRIKKNRIKSY